MICSRASIVFTCSVKIQIVKACPVLIDIIWTNSEDVEGVLYLRPLSINGVIQRELQIALRVTAPHDQCCAVLCSLCFASYAYVE